MSLAPFTVKDLLCLTAVVAVHLFAFGQAVDLPDLGDMIRPLFVASVWCALITLIRKSGIQSLGSPKLRVSAPIYWEPVFGASCVVFLFACFPVTRAMSGGLSISLGFLVYALLFSEVWIGPAGVVSSCWMVPWKYVRRIESKSAFRPYLLVGKYRWGLRVEIPEHLESQVSEFISQSATTN